MTKEERLINWPAAVAICVAACALAFGMWATTRHSDIEAKAQVENNKNRIEYDKWLMEKGFIKEPRIR